MALWRSQGSLPGGNYVTFELRPEGCIGSEKVFWRKEMAGPRTSHIKDPGIFGGTKRALLRL